MNRRTVIAILVAAAILGAIAILVTHMPKPTCSDHVPFFLRGSAVDCSTQH
jgi:hypothetical protein